MEIPYGKLHPSKMLAYGAGSFELTPGVEEAGCPRMYKMKYEERERNVEFSDRLQYGGTVHRAIERAASGNIDLLDALDLVWPEILGADAYEEAVNDLVTLQGRREPYVTVASEIELTMPLIDGTQLAGILDRVAIDPNDPHTLVVEDYKTNRFPPSRADVDKWVQGKTYAALARHHAARWEIEEPVRIVARFHAIKWRPIEVVWSDRQIDMFETWAAVVARNILADEQAAPRINPGCSWCVYKGKCPAFKALPQKGSEIVLEKMSREPLDERARFLVEAKDAVKHLTAYVKDTEAALKEKATVEEPFDSGDGFEYRVSPKTQRTVVDPIRLHGIMGDAYYAAKPRLGDLDRWKKDHPEDAASIDSVIEQESAGVTLRRVLK